MAIQDVILPYPDFIMGEVIDPEQFDLNNSYTVGKIGEVLVVLNQITDSAQSGSGADLIDITPIAPFTSKKLQTYLNDVINRLKATTAGSSGAGLIGAPPIAGVSGTTISAQLTALKALLDTEKARITALEGRASTLEGRATTVESRATALEGRVTTVEGRATKNENDIVALSNRATAVEGRSTTSESRLSKLESDTFNKTEIGAKLNEKTDKTGNHLGTWHGLTPSTAGEPINGARLNVLEGEVFKKGSTPIVLSRGSQVLNVPRDSTVQVVQFEGKTVENPIVLFDSGLWTLHANAVATSPSKLTLTANGTSQFSIVAISVKKNTDYTISFVSPNGLLAVYDNAASIALVPYSNQQKSTFNTGDLDTIRIYLSNGGLGAGTFTFENIMLNEGTQPQEFVANVKGITNPTITVNDKSITLMDTFHKGDTVYVDGDGQAMVNRKRREVVLDGSLPWAFNTAYTGFKRVTALDSSLLSYKPNWNVGVKYNGKLLNYDSVTDLSISKEDGINFGASDGRIYLSIANTDSGWGQDYTPTADEIKAYFMGWQMYNNNVAGGQPYNNTGAKRWARISNKTSDGTYTGVEGVDRTVVVVPTSLNPTTPKWQPYRLIHELATPIPEPVRTIGSISLKKGENQIEVTEGRIVRERVKFYNGGSGCYASNSTFAGEEFTKFSNKVGAILSVSENGKPFHKFRRRTDTVYKHGNERLEIESHNFDPTAIYEVEYIPLEPYKVSAHTNPITIQYQETNGAVTDQLVDDVTGLTSRMRSNEKVMDEIIKGESPAYALKEQEPWVTAVLQNGWTQGGGIVALQYFKSSLGIVYVQGEVLGGTTTPNTIITTIPVGYRPKNSVTASAMRANDASSAILLIGSDGNIAIQSIPNGTGTIRINASYKAER